MIAPKGTRTEAARERRVLELEELRRRLEEAEATLSAIRNGDVDALVVSGENGERIYTLQGAETPYRTLIEAMNEGALTVGRDGTILYANRRFAEMVMVPLERVLGSLLMEFERGDTENVVSRVLSTALQEGASKAEGKLACGPHGETPVMISASRLAEEEGGQLCVVVTDVTARKRTEELQRAEEEARRHRDLAERRATELARSNADLESFAYVVSHDLKEPLRGIGNFAKFLLEDHAEELGVDGREKTQTIIRLSLRMHQLLDSLLEYGRVGRTPPIKSRVCLSEVAREVVESLGSFLLEHNAVVTVQPDLPACWCDRVRIAQLLSNLVLNGVKYNESSPCRVEIGATTEGDQITLYVRDNGIGIEPRHHERIFRMFRRLHGRDLYGGGTGVGLSIAKTIAEQHGGRIWLDSDRGKGSTFYVSLTGVEAESCT